MSDDQAGSVSRRGFLIATGAVAMAAGLGARGAGAQAPPAPPAPIAGKERLIVRSPRPINLEARLSDLTSYHTPDEVFFVRNNYEAPPVTPAQWAVKVEG